MKLNLAEIVKQQQREDEAAGKVVIASIYVLADESGALQLSLPMNDFFRDDITDNTARRDVVMCVLAFTHYWPQITAMADNAALTSTSVPELLVMPWVTTMQEGLAYMAEHGEELAQAADA